ncbi:unnamed protein product [marine sediment metagenome]|uniref:Uncharacterized protein n=1 Tax=marine sediment metagenome TaxID=412755 RepID=X0RQU1_9ZZZZ
MSELLHQLAQETARGIERQREEELNPKIYTKTDLLDLLDMFEDEYYLDNHVSIESTIKRIKERISDS